MKLIELQQSFQESILQQRALPKDCLLKPQKGSLEERLQIYQDAYYLRLIGHLKSKYSALQKTLGVEDFNKLVVNYLQKNPSHGFSIRSLGILLPSFIRVNYPEQVAWAELAEFEWNLTAVLFVNDIKPLSLRDLQTIEIEQWPQLVFKLHPSVVLYQSHYAIPDSWNSLNEEGFAIKWVKQSKAHYYLIWRKQYQSYFTALDAHEKQLFDCLQRQIDFNSLCENLSECLPEDQAATWVSEKLQAWIRDELLML